MDQVRDWEKGKLRETVTDRVGKVKTGRRVEKKGNICGILKHTFLWKFKPTDSSAAGYSTEKDNPIHRLQITCQKRCLHRHHNWRLGCVDEILAATYRQSP